MKHTLSVTFLLVAILLSNRSIAQLFSAESNKDSTLPKVEFGLILGANFQSTSGDSLTHDYKTGIVAAINAGLHKNKFGVRIEVLLTSTSYSSKDATDSVGNKSNIKAIYLNTPLLFEYNIIHWLTLQVGPQYSNLLSAKDPNNLIQDPKILFKGGSFSIVGGLEAKLPVHLSVGARYLLGLSNINNEVIAPASEMWKTNAVQVYVGYSIK